MRTGIILVRPHGEKKFSLLSGPEVELAKQSQFVRDALSANCVSDQYAEIQFWQSDHGAYRTLKCRTSAEAKEAQVKHAKQQKAHEDSQKKLTDKTAKPEKEAQAKPTKSKPATPAA